MYQGLEQQKGRVFLVHEVLVEAIKKECQDPEGKPFFSRAQKRWFPFSEDPASVWNKNMKLDAAFSQVSRHPDLAFKDMGTLSDAMYKRMDPFEKKMGSLKLAMVVTVVVCNLEFCLTGLSSH